MKNKIDSCSTSLHLHGLLRLFIFIFSVFLLTPGLVLKVKAEAGNTREFPLPNTLVLQEQKVVPSDGGTDSYFGRAVAINGSTALIGAMITSFRVRLICSSNRTASGARDRN